MFIFTSFPRETKLKGWESNGRPKRQIWSSLLNWLRASKLNSLKFPDDIHINSAKEIQ
jgi:hypothetical protein